MLLRKLEKVNRKKKHKNGNTNEIHICLHGFETILIYSLMCNVYYYSAVLFTEIVIKASFFIRMCRNEYGYMREVTVLWHIK